MPRPEGFALIAAKPRTWAVLLPAIASDVVLALGSWAATRVARRAEAVRASNAGRHEARFVHAIVIRRSRR